MRGPNGREGEVGSFRISDAQRDLIWQHREALPGQVAEIAAMELGDDGQGPPRAGVSCGFIRQRAKAICICTPTVWSDRTIRKQRRERNTRSFRVRGGGDREK